jgi:hypothetical protein
MAMANLKVKTHFTQVPLATIKEIIEEDIKREAADEQARVSAKNRSEEEFLGVNTR